MESNRWFVELRDLDDLFRNLSAEGYSIIGPRVVRRGALHPVIELGPITSTADMPTGWHEEQSPGRYRVYPDRCGALFSHSPGQQSWKRYLNPQRQRIGESFTDGEIIQWRSNQEPLARYALFGVRPCDAKAIATLDRIFMGEAVPDERYQARRRNTMIIVAQCSDVWETCFCESMGTGPRAESGFDIALTEIANEECHFFIGEAGSDRGRKALHAISTRTATDDEWFEAIRSTDRARAALSRHIPAERVPDILLQSLDDQHWDRISDRCLGCANCTMVCPTCYCTAIEECSQYGPNRTERWRRWISCFEREFSAIHPGVVRPSIRSQYRQWLTHKFANWWSHYGSSGCVGCGRCITWCPVGIDITEEILRFVQQPKDAEDGDHAVQ